jgi:hypothetical protein
MARPLKTAVERALFALMREVSEASYCSGWESGLEYTLWNYVQSAATPSRASTAMDGSEELNITATQRADLLVLSDLCGGWIMRDETTVFVTFAEWEEERARQVQTSRRNRKLIRDAKASQVGSGS